MRIKPVGRSFSVCRRLHKESEISVLSSPLFRSGTKCFAPPMLSVITCHAISPRAQINTANSRWIATSRTTSQDKADDLPQIAVVLDQVLTTVQVSTWCMRTRRKELAFIERLASWVLGRVTVYETHLKELGPMT